MENEYSRRKDGIRESIAALEGMKDSIVRLLGKQLHLSKAQENMWASDIKETYYSCIAAWEMLNGAKKGIAGSAACCRDFLSTANSRMEQSASELRSLNTAEAFRMESQLKVTYGACHNLISTALEPFEVKMKVESPIASIVRTSDTEYELHCVVCGKKAATFSIGIAGSMEQERLNYRGITSTSSLELKEKRRIFRWLEQCELAEVHRHVKQIRAMEDGLDVYCPDCDEIYCREHYLVSEQWDEGFYDYAYGTCPIGHKRIIDD